MLCADAGKPGEAVHASFSGYVAREMGKAEALLKVVGSRPENLVDNFFTLMPSGSPADFQRILELKACCPHDTTSLLGNALAKFAK